LHITIRYFMGDAYKITIRCMLKTPFV